MALQENMSLFNKIRYFKEIIKKNKERIDKMKHSEIEISIRFKMSLWDCIKLRISGLSRNVESIDSIGQAQSIKYRYK